MKYYVYLDQDGALVVKDREHLDTYDPGYWSRNYAFVQVMWPVDTEDKSSLRSLLDSFSRRKLKEEDVRICLNQIGLDFSNGKLTRKPSP